MVSAFTPHAAQRQGVSINNADRTGGKISSQMGNWLRGTKSIACSQLPYFDSPTMRTKMWGAEAIGRETWTSSLAVSLNTVHTDEGGSDLRITEPSHIDSTPMRRAVEHTVSITRGARIPRHICVGYRKVDRRATRPPNPNLRKNPGGARSQNGFK